VLIGTTPEGRKELVGFTDGARESAQDWRDLLLDLKRRGLDVPPRLVIADGALGFWKAAGEVWPRTREQRCWVHKTANVLAKLPKSQQPKAKRALQEIWMAETKVAAELAFDTFVESYALKYERAADCLSQDRDALLAFYEFPAEHWKHLRTTNPIESTFATVRHRTIRSKGCLSNRTALAMVFKLLEGTRRARSRVQALHKPAGSSARSLQGQDGQSSANDRGRTDRDPAYRSGHIPGCPVRLLERTLSHGRHHRAGTPPSFPH
jgi:putative transposase